MSANDTERVNNDIYDDFILKKNIVWSFSLYKKISALYGLINHHHFTASTAVNKSIHYISRQERFDCISLPF